MAKDQEANVVFDAHVLRKSQIILSRLPRIDTPSSTAGNVTRILLGGILSAVCALGMFIGLSSPYFENRLLFALLGMIFLLVVYTVSAAFVSKRRGQVQVVSTKDALYFGTYRFMPWVNFVGATLASLLAVPVWLGILHNNASKLPVLSYLLLVVSFLALPAAGRAWTGRTQFYHLLFKREYLEVSIGRNRLTAAWDDIRGAQLESVGLGPPHVVITTFSNNFVKFSVWDLSSDVGLLVELINFYRKNPAARKEIGEEALGRIHNGDF